VSYPGDQLVVRYTYRGMRIFIPVGLILSLPGCKMVLGMRGKLV
jgi:homoaconitase/3-isopropylmalate dehydratase large subunit